MAWSSASSSSSTGKGLSNLTAPTGASLASSSGSDSITTVFNAGFRARASARYANRYHATIRVPKPMTCAVDRLRSSDAPSSRRAKRSAATARNAPSRAIGVRELCYREGTQPSLGPETMHAHRDRFRDLLGGT